MTINLRPYRPTDAERINQIAVNAFEQFKDNFSGWDSFIRGVGQMSQLAESAQIIVAEVDHIVEGAVGYIGPNIEKWFFPQEVPCIRMLVVNPAARGNGLGRRLTQECINRAVQDGSDKIGLHTSPIMNVALPLYLRMGFIKDHDIEPIRGVPYAIYYKALK